MIRRTKFPPRKSPARKARRDARRPMTSDISAPRREGQLSRFTPTLGEL